MFRTGRNRLIVALAAGCLLFVPTYGRSTALTPELFGLATVYSAQVGAYKVEVVSGWGRWLVVERRQGNTAQCLILPVRSPLSDARAVYCEKWYTSAGKFSGFIYFRGHERPYCGAATANALPGKCLRLGTVTHG